MIYLNIKKTSVKSATTLAAAIGFMLLVSGCQSMSTKQQVATSNNAEGTVTGVALPEKNSGFNLASLPKTTKPIAKKQPSRFAYRQSSSACSDFLSDMGVKPEGVTFIGCNARFQQNGHAQIANYRLKGKRAYAVQEQLHRHTGMPRLTKDCCSWSSIDQNTGKSAGFIKFAGEPYMVSMRSAELRLGWDIASDIHSIPTFYVHVAKVLN